MSFMTVLQKIGHGIKVGFEKALGIEQKLQPVLAPFEALINPALPALINAGVAAVANMEGMAAMAGAQNGSGSVKSAAVVASLAQTLGPTLVQLGVDPTKVTTGQYKTFVDAIVAASNAFITEETIATPTPTPVATTSNITAAPVTGAAIPNAGS